MMICRSITYYDTGIKSSRHNHSRTHSISTHRTEPKCITYTIGSSTFCSRLSEYINTMRMAMHSVAAIMIAFLSLIMANPLLNKEHTTPGQEFIQTLPKCERPDFFTFELGRGYAQTATYSERSYDDFQFPDALDIDNELIEKFQNLDVPQNFTTNLYSMVQTEFSLDNEQMRTLILERSVCSNSYMCINIEDIGSLCCPF